MDQRDVGGNSGRGTVEVCDILSNSTIEGYKRLIHIKDWSGSETFSHLCFQSLVSAEALSCNNFRERAKKTLTRYETKNQLTLELERTLDDKNEPLIKSFMSDLDDRMKKINSNHEISNAISGYLEEKKIVPLCELKTNEYLDTMDNLLLINQRFEPNQYMVVLALVHKDSEKTISSCLPFFSRLSLRDTARSLQELRYNVGFNFIKKQNQVQF